MRVYAALSTSVQDQLNLEAVEYPWVLVSFANPQRSTAARLRNRPALLLDSGAFSVWTLGRAVDVDDYAYWARAYCERLPGTIVANLDVIPGRFAGGPPTRRERLRAAEQGMENADCLRGHGLRVMEVFHRYEPLSLLDRLVERRRPGEMLAFGGLVGIKDRAGKVPFVASAFERIREASGGGWDRLVPVHGFGLSPDTELGSTFPWFSMDSTSWINPRRFGREVMADGFQSQKNTGVPVPAELARVYLRRRLRYWMTMEASLTEFWRERGVDYLDLEGAATCATGATAAS